MEFTITKYDVQDLNFFLNRYGIYPQGLYEFTGTYELKILKDRIVLARKYQQQGIENKNAPEY